jgi:tetratricopeptide (TPR) repeat protein
LVQAARALDGVDPHGSMAADFAFWKGRTLFAARQPFLAIPWLQASLKSRSDDPDTNRWLAAAAYDLGDRLTAVRALEAVTRLAPRDARAWRTLALVFKENVDYERARAAYEASLRADPNQPQARLELAETLVQLGDAAAAEGELTACKGRVPEADWSNLFARAKQLRGDVAGWRAAVDTGLAAAPDHPGLLAQRAQIDLAEGRPGEALELLNRAIATDPYRAETLYQRGVALRTLGDVDQAARDFARSAELKQALADMSDLNERAARAIGDADVRYRLGQLCVTLGKPELAASWYRAALACNPNHSGARAGLKVLRLHSTVR